MGIWNNYHLGRKLCLRYSVANVFVASPDVPLPGVSGEAFLPAIDEDLTLTSVSTAACTMNSARAWPPSKLTPQLWGSIHLEFYVITCCSSKRNNLVRVWCLDVFRSSDETARFSFLIWTQPLWL